MGAPLPLEWTMPLNSSPAMTKLDEWSLRILAAARLGLHPNHVKEAQDHLQGKPLEAMMDVSLCREAGAINKRLADDEFMVCEANECISSLMAQFGLSQVS